MDSLSKILFKSNWEKKKKEEFLNSLKLPSKFKEPMHTSNSSGYKTFHQMCIRLFNPLPVFELYIIPQSSHSSLGLHASRLGLSIFAISSCISTFSWSPNMTSNKILQALLLSQEIDSYKFHSHRHTMIKHGFFSFLFCSITDLEHFSNWAYRSIHYYTPYYQPSVLNAIACFDLKILRKHKIT